MVEHGDERGRTLGFPTANLVDVSEVRLDGVYAGVAQIEPENMGPLFVAAVSVGHRPTYYRGDGLRLLEAHLIDFNNDLYGKTLRVELHTRLRPQHAYVDTPTLVRQLHLDVAATRAWARANALGELLVTDRENQGRWSGGRRATFARRRKAARSDVVADRAKRREARLLAAIDRATAEVALTHERVAELSGLPLDYVLWRYPAQGDMSSLQSHDAR
jgi:riboflavin kinase/FMN adenylyltransferase